MQHAEYFKTFLRDVVNLNETRLDLLEARVAAVTTTLQADDTVGELMTGFDPQGSWKHRLIIRPQPGGNFDADVLVEMNERAGWEPKDYINAIYNALHSDGTYSKQEHGRKDRCVFLRYAPINEVGCHLDLVPFITLDNGNRVIVNRRTNTWEPEYGSTDPQGFTDWVRRRDELTGNQFRKVVRIMKFLRDRRKSFTGARSVILTTVLGTQISDWTAADFGRYSNLPTALVNIVEDLDGWLQARPVKPSIANPNNDGTNFDHRWTQETYANFRDRVHSIAAEIRAAYDEPDAKKSATKWQALLGDSFNPPNAKTSSNSANPFTPAATAVGAASSRISHAG